MVPINIIIIFVQFFYFTIGYVNLAINKTAWQTSNYFNYYASNAVDGNTNQKVGGKSCAIINGETASGTWRVDLERILSIHHITIYYRNEVSTWRMAGFFLYVSNTTKKDDGHLCFHELQTKAPPYIMSINCIHNARYVIYYNDRNRTDVTYPPLYSKKLWNELCEVEVYGCNNPGFYGQNCSTPCPINCKNKYCYIVNGTCLSCIDGYQGLSCEQTCAQGTYGLDCKHTCNPNCKNTQCNHVDGKCTDGCETGYDGNFCEKVCDSGTYGLKCNRTCNVNCYSNTRYLCHHVNGNCTTGCKPGWQRPHCDQVCTLHFYGNNCGLRCGNCMNNVTCNHISGTCPNGCEPGWQGDKCEKVCDSGKYGNGCNQNCSENCIDMNQICHHMTGKCIGGCKSGWKGGHCDTKCNERMYGVNCSLPCGYCLNSAQCNHITGSCSGGCDAGYIGDTCIDVCELRKYGHGCIQSCSENCIDTNRVCDHVTGTCIGGCQTGWKGGYCNNICDPGKYGSGCNQSCNENCNGTQNTCDHVTGECINGCKPGWKGEKCDTDASTDESVFQLQRTKQSNILLIGAIVGWVFNGIFIVSLIIFLTLYKLRKKRTHKDNREIYDDINMDRRDEHHVYSSITSKK